MSEFRRTHSLTVGSRKARVEFVAPSKFLPAFTSRGTRTPVGKKWWVVAEVRSVTECEDRTEAASFYEKADKVLSSRKRVDTYANINDLEETW